MRIFLIFKEEVSFYSADHQQADKEGQFHDNPEAK